MGIDYKNVTSGILYNLETGEVIAHFSDLTLNGIEVDFSGGNGKKTIFDKLKPKTCGDGCHVICDFCTHYVDDNKLLVRDEFTGEGICWFHKKEQDALGACDNFQCFNYKG